MIATDNETSLCCKSFLDSAQSKPCLLLKASVNGMQFAREAALCTVTCGQQLACGHTCTFTCGECSQMTVSTEDVLANSLSATSLSGSISNTGGRDRHPACVVLCGKTLACGHACSKKCHPTTEPCALCFQKCPVSCEHSNCPARCLEVCSCVSTAAVPDILS